MGFPGNQSLSNTRIQGAARGKVSSTHSRIGSRDSQASRISAPSNEKPRSGTRDSRVSGVSVQSKEKLRTGTRDSQASGISAQSKEKPNFYSSFPQEKRGGVETSKASSSDSRPPMFLSYPFSQGQRSGIDSNKGKEQARPRTPPSRAMSASGVESWRFMSSHVSATDDHSLRQPFRPNGEMDKSNVLYDRETGRPQGFVTFAHTQSMKDGVKRMSGRNLNGRNITPTKPGPRALATVATTAGEAAVVGNITKAEAEAETDKIILSFKENSISGYYDLSSYNVCGLVWLSPKF